MHAHELYTMDSVNGTFIVDLSSSSKLIFGLSSLALVFGKLQGSSRVLVIVASSWWLIDSRSSFKWITGVGPLLWVALSNIYFFLLP